MHRCTPLAAALAALTLAGCAQAEPRAGTERGPFAGPAYRFGVVAVANPYGAEAGARILERGGNAIDAAVAIAYALNVVEPQSAGIGGGGFMMIHLAATGETFAIDSRERAPAAATPDMFAGVPNASLQGVAVGVPGMVRGTALALERWGSRPLAAVLQPAIELADDGFAATARYAQVNCNSRSQNSPEAAAFFCPNGAPPVQGSLVQNKPLAETFRLLAKWGPDCFYSMKLAEKGCDIAQGIVEGQKFTRAEPGSKGGSMSYADLEAYEPTIRQPIEGTYRGWRIKSMAPPSSGALTMLQVLKMLEPFPIGDATQGYGFGSVKTVNVMAEAMRLAFADRSVWMGDADFVPVPSKGLLDATYLGLRDDAIVPGQRMQPNPLPGDPRAYDVAGTGRPGPMMAVAPPVTGPGETTTHFSVIDRHGNMVSYTNTIESSHGIGVFAGYKRPDGSFRNHGFLLNNELTDFNLAPTTNPYTGGPGFNDVQPGKRPRSSMTPSMIFTPGGKPLLAYGSPGGATIINSVINVTLNLIDHKMDIQQAIDAPRISVTSANPSITVEAALPQETVQGLVALGYTVGTADIGSVQAVLVNPLTGQQYGAADRRREGTVIGLPRRDGR